MVKYLWYTCLCTYEKYTQIFKYILGNSFAAGAKEYNEICDAK